jgi:methyltransferase
MIVFALLAVEAARAARHEREQLSRGAIEPPDDVYPLMRLAYPGAFLAMFIEGFLRSAPSPRLMAAGVVLFGLAKLLKWWAILTLGRSWTFRVLVVPGDRRVAAGPYRLLRHPNYVAVVGELVSVALITGARITGPAVTAAFGFLMLKRIAVENRALDAILRADPR